MEWQRNEEAMLFFSGGLGLIFIALWIFCVVDTITTPENQVRNLPKLAWVFIVLLFLDIGAIAWLLGGRPWTKVPANRPTGATRARTTGWGAGPSAPRRAANPDDDEEFLASLRKRADEQRRRAQQQKKDLGENDPS
jgi:hypothetical protein